jgi:hypothetical protein
MLAQAIADEVEREHAESDRDARKDQRVWRSLKR